MLVCSSKCDIAPALTPVCNAQTPHRPDYSWEELVRDRDRGQSEQNGVNYGFLTDPSTKACLLTSGIRSQTLTVRTIDSSVTRWSRVVNGSVPAFSGLFRNIKIVTRITYCANTQARRIPGAFHSQTDGLPSHPNSPTTSRTIHIMFETADSEHNTTGRRKLT